MWRGGTVCECFFIDNLPIFRPRASIWQGSLARFLLSMDVGEVLFIHTVSHFIHSVPIVKRRIQFENEKNNKIYWGMLRYTYQGYQFYHVNYFIYLYMYFYGTRNIFLSNLWGYGLTSQMVCCSLRHNKLPY